MADDLIEIVQDSTRGSFFLVSGQIVALIVQAVAVFIIARLLGPELYGIYTLSLVLPEILSIVIDFGVDNGIIRFSANLRATGKHKQIGRLIRSGLLFKSLMGLVFFSICLILSGHLATYVLSRPDIGFYISLASIALIARAASSVTFSAFVGLDRMDYGALTICVQAFAKTIISVLLVVAGLGIVGALIGTVASYIISGVLGIALLYFNLYRHVGSHEESLPQHSWNKSLRNLLGYGSPLYVSALLLGIIPNLQSLILANFASDYEIGNFKASLNFVALLSTLTVAIATSLFSAFSKFEKNSDNAKALYKQSTKYVSALVVPASLLIIILSKEIVQIVYGQSFASTSLYLSLHATIFLLIGLGYHIQQSLFNGLGKTKETLRITAIHFSFFILLAPYLTQQLKVPGLILSILASSTVATIYGAYRVKSRFKVESDFRSIVRLYAIAFGAATPAFLVAEFLSIGPIFRTIIASVVYLISYLTILPLVQTLRRSLLKDVEIAIQKTGPFRSIIKLVLKYEYAIANLSVDRS